MRIRYGLSAGLFLVSTMLAGAAGAEQVTVRSCNHDVTFDEVPQRAIAMTSISLK
jgi:iron complex transport system substrate-binding protein